MVRWCDGYVSESWSKQSVLARRFALFSSEDQFCFEEQPFFGSLLLIAMWYIMLKTFTRSWLHMADLPLNFAVRSVRVTHRSSNITYDHRVILVLFETRVYRRCKHVILILGFVCSYSCKRSYKSVATGFGCSLWPNSIHLVYMWHILLRTTLSIWAHYNRCRCSCFVGGMHLRMSENLIYSQCTRVTHSWPMDERTFGRILLAHSVNACSRSCTRFFSPPFTQRYHFFRPWGVFSPSIMSNDVLSYA